MSKYKIRLLALVNPKISFKNKREFSFQRRAFIVPLLTINLYGVIGAILIKIVLKMALQLLISVPLELWENRSQAPPPPTVKRY